METIENVVADLSTLKNKLREEAQLLFDGLGGTVKPCDAMALSSVHRAILLMDGSIPLFEQKNLIVGAAVVRMQLDTFLRFKAVSSSSDPHGLALRWLQGESLRDIPGDDGRKLTDNYLVNNEGDPEVRNMYDWSNAHVHLSGTHFLHLLEASPLQPDGRRLFRVGAEVDYVSQNHVFQWGAALRQATGAVLWAVTQWRQRRAEIDQASMR